MAIKDLSDDVRMPRIGKIHLGKRDPRGFPVKTDYFVLPETHPAYPDLVRLFGKEPKELRVQIPTENIIEWAPQFYKAYDLTHGLICKGDGMAARRLVDVESQQFPTKTTKTTTMIDIDCQGRECPYYRDKKCGEVMNLLFVLPEVPGLGVWQIDTGSINSILNINSCARLIKNAFKRLVNIPLKLTLEPHQVNNPDNGRKQTVYVLNLRTDFSLNQLATAARQLSQRFMIESPDMAAVMEDVVERDIAELWPGDRNPEGQSAKAVVDSTAREVKEVGGNPATPAPMADSAGVTQSKPTFGEALTWCANHGKQFGKKWFLDNCGFSEKELQDEPVKVEKAMQNICAFTEWEMPTKGGT